MNKLGRSPISKLTSMTRKTEFGVSWKRRDSESVTEVMDLEAAVGGTTRKTARENSKHDMRTISDDRAIAAHLFLGHEKMTCGL